VRGSVACMRPPRPVMPAPSVVPEGDESSGSPSPAMTASLARSVEWGPRGAMSRSLAPKGHRMRRRCGLRSLSPIAARSAANHTPQLNSSTRYLKETAVLSSQHERPCRLCCSEHCAIQALHRSPSKIKSARCVIKVPQGVQ
jgi:hypothetical protein